MLITLDIKDSAYDKMVYFLNNFMKNDAKIIETSEHLDIEIVTEDDPDYKYVLDAREARKNGEKTHAIDDVIKEFE